MRSFRTLFSALFALGCLLDTSAAHADCAAPRDYVAQVTGNQVTVCPTYVGADGLCPQAGGMLRVALSDAGVADAVERLPDFCQAPPTSLGSEASSCYVDECVPPGTYQYGFATPLSCSYACGGEYAIEVSVTTPLSDCISDAGAPSDASSVPWQPSTATGGSVNDPSCVYAGGGDAGAPVDTQDASSDAGPLETSDASAQTANDGGSQEVQGSPASPSSSGSGSCAVVTPGRTEHTVLAIDALALAFGIVTLGRRRSRRAKRSR